MSFSKFQQTATLFVFVVEWPNNGEESNSHAHGGLALDRDVAQEKIASYVSHKYPYTYVYHLNCNVVLHCFR